jgi:hypothetical protein
MSSGGSLSIGGGLILPQARLFLNPNGVQSGQHDTVSVGGLTKAEWERLKDLKPFAALLRYKSGYSAGVSRALGNGVRYRYDNKRGWVHPASWDGSNDISRVRNGRHNTRSGSQPPERITERELISNNQYQIFDLQNWFLDTNNKAYNFPIVRIADINSNWGGGNGNLNGVTFGQEHSALGKNGQGGNRTFAGVNNDRPMFCDSTRTIGNQVQYFAFAIGCNDPDNERQIILGNPSQTIKAEIYPRVLIKYGKPIYNDRGRKIRLRQV